MSLETVIGLSYEDSLGIMKRETQVLVRHLEASVSVEGITLEATRQVQSLMDLTLKVGLVNPCHLHQLSGTNLETGEYLGGGAARSLKFAPPSPPTHPHGQGGGGGGGPLLGTAAAAGGGGSFNSSSSTAAVAVAASSDDRFALELRERWRAVARALDLSEAQKTSLVGMWTRHRSRVVDLMRERAGLVAELAAPLLAPSSSSSSCFLRVAAGGGTSQASPLGGPPPLPPPPRVAPTTHSHSFQHMTFRSRWRPCKRTSTRSIVHIQS